MKIERISENIIKITISLADLEERDIDLDTLNYNSPEAQELFWDMMEQAELECGFNVSDSQIFIEPVPDAEEGFSITITRIDDEGDFESIHKYIKNKFRKNDPKIRKNLTKEPSVLIYAFESFDDLTALCGKIQDSYFGESSLYKLQNKYYLLLAKDGFILDDISAFEVYLDEFAERVYNNTTFFLGYLQEYGDTLIETSAVETIHFYFN